ncbi:restriction endonuclease subunit S [Mesoflavibacter zeaxanthinifaciens]|uniref:restriction endonuclease subunit S n=1 Tax=Mesoflavibacter zeaxanthinifaciens TaxID=393060 RepID=UPI003A95B4DF
MIEGWEEVKFGDVVQFPPRIKMVKGKIYPFIPMENLDSGIKYVKPIIEKELQGGGAKFEEGDTLFSRITPCLQNGKIAQAIELDGKPGFGSTEYFVFRGIKNKTDTDFIYYLSKSQWFKGNAENSMVGSSGRQRADAGFVRNLKINLPPLKTQRKIASILSAYDDLIENNLKRIKLLEEQAQQTYEEWFVRFKFPGYEDVGIDEVTGLPVGWDKVKLVDCCHLVMGQSPKSEFYNFEKRGLPFHQGVKDYGFRFPTNSSWSTQGNRIAEEDSILFSVRAPVGRLNVAIEKIIIGRGLASINHKKGWNGFLLYQLQNIFYEDNLMGGGAIYNSVTKRDVERIEIIQATKEINIKFNEISSNIDKQIKNLTKQNQLLKEARDILLPRLMGGMIDVEDLEVKDEVKRYGVDDYLEMEGELGQVAEKGFEYNNKK